MLAVGRAVVDALRRPADGAEELALGARAAVRAGDAPADAGVGLGLALRDALHEVHLRPDVGDGLDEVGEELEGLVLVACPGSSTRRPSCRASSRLFMRAFPPYALRRRRS